MSITHVRDRANPVKINNPPGTCFSQMDVAGPFSANIANPMIIKIVATIDNATKMVVDNIF